ncbi:MAG TPA: hypothetical protein VKA84_08685 [Gemmatimonadaceae bacterium]|nr:hypothetical protein [Gemmatimonadaceae bacterium]
MNRLKEFLNEPPEDTPPDDFWVVTGDCGFFYVSEHTAHEIGCALDEQTPPKWLNFRDLSGSRVRVKSRQVDSIYEVTASQRAAERQFHRARKLEQKADRRPWEDDD